MVCPSGYSRVAAEMSGDKSLAIFRRFDELNILRLLRLQEEICQLQLMPKLKEYNELLLQVYHLSKLESPNATQLTSFQILARDNNMPVMTWGAYPSMTRPPFMDAFVDMFHWFCGGCPNVGRVIGDRAKIVSYRQSTINKAGNVMATILASTLPVVTIFVLNSLHNTNRRIGLTTVFIAIFALVLVTFTSARRVEIFAATATFAAVEVVFIGSAISSTTNAATASTNATTLEAM
ncbi:uncharacterized protein Z518_06015 [Rhinocladiella mackenziei CBS 650.93]|uniref:Rhinocladiella mackenziei CBS 650.93 unplaced genomic scaffold supercont1.4, whole genome shotgun sequence n=1 Tax=Rhinocladiella mackenziei CBS 650.93 TaxID=1442369 RepID=A0A0D2H409_9EURO|nr:uncharacterized protein Z518_06015 [Rhinocladiella mackenziei CBS 650.93]KIX05143.1 hypothetical protein Z518_06015 [Rhinocladiella mackenziei CBS 650.93]